MERCWGGWQAAAGPFNPLGTVKKPGRYLAWGWHSQNFSVLADSFLYFWYIIKIWHFLWRKNVEESWIYKFTLTLSLYCHGMTWHSAECFNVRFSPRLCITSTSKWLSEKVFHLHLMWKWWCLFSNIIYWLLSLSLLRIEWEFILPPIPLCMYVHVFLRRCVRIYMGLSFHSGCYPAPCECVLEAEVSAFYFPFECHIFFYH